MNEPTVSVPKTQGALLLGGCLATGLSGIVAVQTLLYFKLYPSDGKPVKALVLLIWALDITHTGLVIGVLWHFLIVNFTVPLIYYIPSTLALAVVFTAITTFLVHCYYAHRIWRLSSRSWCLTLPVMFLAICRLVSACASSTEMLRVTAFPVFRERFRWLGALGLALSTTVDVLITIELLFLLRQSRCRSLSLDQVIDYLIVYALAVGSLTSAGTITSMITWLTFDQNLAFLSLHFALGKLYANSLLASLNTRLHLRSTHAGRESTPVTIEKGRRTTIRCPTRKSYTTRISDSTLIPPHHVQINVEKSVVYDSAISNKPAYRYNGNI